MCVTEIRTTLERALARTQDGGGRPALCGPYERLMRVLEPTFQHVIEPENPERVALIRQSLEAAKHDVVILFSIAMRFRYLKNQLTNEPDNEERALRAIVAASTEADIGTIHSLVRSIGNHFASAVLNTFDGIVGPFDFQALINQVEVAPAPLGVGYPLGEAILSVKSFFNDANAICRQVETMGCREIAHVSADKKIQFQLLDWKNDSILSGTRLNLGMPETIVNGHLIDLELYLGVVLGLIVACANEIAHNLYNILSSTGLIHPKAVLSMLDPATFEVLRGLGIPDETLAQLMNSGPVTVTVDRTPITMHYFIGSNEGVECIRSAIEYLE